MTRAWPKVRLGEVLRRSEIAVRPDPKQEYREITVRLWGNGVVERGKVDGASIADSRRFVARAGQLIVSRIDARNGAIGIVPEFLDGALVSNDFPLFHTDNQRIDAHYLGWLSRTADFVQLCKVASEGTTNRVRLKEDRFLSLEIALPPLAEQQRIVSKVETLVEQIQEAHMLRKMSADEARELISHTATTLFPGGGNTTVGDFVRFQTGYAFKSEWFSDSGIRLARNANIGHGVLDWSDTARLPAERRDEFPRFELAAGDILVALDRPIISTGIKVARVRDEDLPSLLLQRVARAQFTDDSVLSDYFFHWLRSPYFSNAIDPGRSNGVPHISHKDIERIPFSAPSLAEQRRIVAELDAVQTQVAALMRIQTDTKAELDALLPALLDKAFRGELTNMNMEEPAHA